MSLTAGQQARRSATLTVEHGRLYSRITGDYNPLRVDTEFTAATLSAYRWRAEGPRVSGFGDDGPHLACEPMKPPEWRFPPASTKRFFSLRRRNRS